MMPHQRGRGILASLSITIIFSILLSHHSASCFQPLISFAQRVSSPTPTTAHATRNNNDDVSANVDDAILSRRRLLGKTMSSIAIAASSSSILLDGPSIASAKVVASPLPAVSYSTSVPSSPERDALLQAIANKSSNDIILSAIEKILPFNPLKSTTDNPSAEAIASNYKNALDGQWKLLWYNTSEFSPLLKLPSPFRPDSYQYFGSIAATEVGEGRVAQGLTGGILANKQLWLSSGAIASNTDPSILEIYPPFRFQLGNVVGSTSPKKTIVESESDADFRAANARTKDAQLAPKNEYEQLYLENYGRGSLRVSVVVRGDPVIVGEMFIHQKL